MRAVTAFLRAGNQSKTPQFMKWNISIYIYFFFTFEVITCPALLESMGTSVSPKPQCLVVGGRKVNETCKFSCNNGYELPDPKKDTLTCLVTGSWDAPIINCQRKSRRLIGSVSLNFDRELRFAFYIFRLILNEWSQIILLSLAFALLVRLFLSFNLVFFFICRCFYFF